MALENLRSAYGPSNKKGQVGTGEVNDTLGNYKGASALENARSRFQTSEKKGKKPTGPDTGGNIPSEKLSGLS